MITLVCHSWYLLGKIVGHLSDLHCSEFDMILSKVYHLVGDWVGLTLILVVPPFVPDRKIGIMKQQGFCHPQT